MKKLIFFSAVFLLTVVNSSHAALISNVTASTPDMGFAFDAVLDNTVNGHGLSGNIPSLTADHDSTHPDNSWVSDNGLTTGTIIFDLGGSYYVDEISFWNQNHGGPADFGENGINGVTMQASTNGGTFITIPGSPSSLSQVSGFGPVGPELIEFDPVLATHIQFIVLSNHGDLSNTGFAEVQFGAIPEPETYALLLAGGGAIACLMRRRWSGV